MGHSDPSPPFVKPFDGVFSATPQSGSIYPHGGNLPHIGNTGFTTLGRSLSFFLLVFGFFSDQSLTFWVVFNSLEWVILPPPGVNYPRLGNTTGRTYSRSLSFCSFLFVFFFGPTIDLLGCLHFDSIKGSIYPRWGSLSQIGKHWLNDLGSDDLGLSFCSFWGFLDQSPTFLGCS